MKWYKNTEKVPLKDDYYFILDFQKERRVWSWYRGEWVTDIGNVACVKCDDFKWLSFDDYPWCAIGCSEDGRDGL